MDPARLDHLLAQVTDWCSRQPEVEAAALIGSHARRQADPDSDVDLLILHTHPSRLLEDPGWTGAFGEVLSRQVETWGDVRSIRVGYRSGPEVEFAIADPDWARPPLDAGKRRVVAAGFRPLFDRSGRLTALATAG